MFTITKYTNCQSYKHIEFLLTVILVFICINPARGQEIKADTMDTDSYIFLPALGSSPETGFLFGGLGIYQFKLGNIPSKTRNSSLFLSAIYTLNEQLSTSFLPTIILPNETWIFNGVYAYSYFPELFWGVGNEAFDSEESQFYSRKIYSEQTGLSKVGENLFFGPTVTWQTVYDIRFENSGGGSVDYSQLNGTSDYSETGLGLNLMWDERDNMVTPTQNHLIKANFTVYPSFLSTLDTYSQLMLDGRKYFDFREEGTSVLALQALMLTNFGNPPVNSMAKLGGQNVLRGYYTGRLRDNHGAQVQAEFRQKVYGNFGMVAFAAAGQVWPDYNSVNLSNTRVSGGLGFRYNLDKKNPTNIRLDIAIGQNSSGMYITIGEAF